MNATELQPAVRPDCAAIAQVMAGVDAKWCVWNYRPRPKGKPAKVPSDGRRKLSTSEPEKWLTFDEAVKLYESGRFDGIGLLIGSCKPVLVALDLDDCLDDEGNVKPESAEIVAAAFRIKTYCEISPSGRGLRLLVRGVTPDGYQEKSGNLEVYGAGSIRYLTLTGCPFGEVRPIGPWQETEEALFDFVARFGKPEGSGAIQAAGHVAGGDGWPVLTYGELSRYAKGGAKGRKLMEGDFSDYAGASEARGALVELACAYTNDMELIARLLEESGLLKSKEGEKRGGVPMALYEARRIVEGLEKAGRRRNHWEDKAAKVAADVVSKAQQKSVDERLDSILLDGGSALLRRDKAGNVKSTISNAVHVLRHTRALVGAVAFNEFAQMPVVALDLSLALSGGGAVAQAGLWQPVRDADLRAIDAYLQTVGVELRSMNDIRRAVNQWADSNRIHPVRERLLECHAEWQRAGSRHGWGLDEWLLRWAGIDGSADNPADEDEDEGGERENVKALREYVRRVGRLLFIGAIKRALEPGCQFDYFVIFESPAGYFKDTFARAFAEALYSLGFLGGVSLHALDLEFKRSLRGRIFAWAPELAGMSKADNDRLKSAITDRADHYRDPFGVFFGDVPRTCIFGGGTNERQYLQDTTGARRYLPVRFRRKLSKAELSAMLEAIPLLWGEAYDAYLKGEAVYFDEESNAALVATQAREVAKRLRPDGWAELIEDFNSSLLYGTAGTPAGAGRGKAAGWCLDMSFRLGDLMQAVLTSDGPFSVADERRFIAALGRAGWEWFRAQGRGRWRLKATTKAELRAQR